MSVWEAAGVARAAGLAVSDVTLLRVAYHLRLVWAIRRPLLEASRRTLAPKAWVRNHRSAHIGSLDSGSETTGTFAQEIALVYNTLCTSAQGRNGDAMDDDDDDGHRQQQCFEQEYDGASAAAWLYSRRYCDHARPPGVDNNPFLKALCPIRGALHEGDVPLACYLFRLRIDLEHDEYFLKKRSVSGGWLRESKVAFSDYLPWLQRFCESQPSQLPPSGIGKMPRENPQQNPQQYWPWPPHNHPYNHHFNQHYNGDVPTVDMWREWCGHLSYHAIEDKKSRAATAAVSHVRKLPSHLLGRLPIAPRWPR